ncbi:MAG: hypothetical protein KF774_11330 [Planctomyces sp.]|nr:hypothetical protein [Planctomyces sp.]
MQTAVVYLEGDEVQLNQALDELESDPSIVEVGDFGTLAEVPGDYLAGNAAGVAGAAVAPLSTSVVADPQPSDDLKALSTEAASRLDAYRDPEESAEEDVAEEPAKHNVPAPAPAFAGGTEVSETQQADGDSPGAVRSRMQIPVPPETQPAERAITRASRSGAAPANMNNSYQVIVPEGDAEAVVQQLRNMTPRQSYQQNYRRNLRSAAPPPAVREPAIPEAAPAEADQRKSDAAGRVRVLIILQQPQAGGNSSQFAAPGQSPD